MASGGYRAGAGRPRGSTVHEKAADKKLGKKEQKLESAKKAENVFTAQRKIPNSKPQIVVNNS